MNGSGRCAECVWPSEMVVDTVEEKKGALIAFIGEGPADEEKARGALFVGPAGREQERTIARAGMARSECSFENAHGCARPKWATVGQELQAVERCRGRLAEWLHRNQPRGVALLGGRALRSVCPAFAAGSGDGLMRHRGSIWRREEISAANQALELPDILPASVRFVVATIHPAAIIRRERIEKFSSMGYRMVPALDVKRLRQCVEKGRELLPIERMDGPPSWSGEPFVFDLEGYERPEWVGVQHVDGGPVWGGQWDEMKEWLRRQMRWKCLKVGQNILGWDLPMLAREGIQLKEPFWDTMAAAGMCESDMARGLHFLASYYFGDKRPFWKDLVVHKPQHERRKIALRAAWREVPMPGKGGMEWDREVERVYNEMDVDSTRLVMVAQRERARQEGWL